MGSSMCHLKLFLRPWLLQPAKIWNNDTLLKISAGLDMHEYFQEYFLHKSENTAYKNPEYTHLLLNYKKKTPDIYNRLLHAFKIISLTLHLLHNVILKNRFQNTAVNYTEKKVMSINISRYTISAYLNFFAQGNL